MRPWRPHQASSGDLLRRRRDAAGLFSIVFPFHDCSCFELSPSWERVSVGAGSVKNYSWIDPPFKAPGIDSGRSFRRRPTGLTSKAPAKGRNSASGEASSEFPQRIGEPKRLGSPKDFLRAPRRGVYTTSQSDVAEAIRQQRKDGELQRLGRELFTFLVTKQLTRVYCAFFPRRTDCSHNSNPTTTGR